MLNEISFILVKVNESLGGGYIKYENNNDTCFTWFSLLGYLDEIKIHLVNIINLLCSQAQHRKWILY